MASSACAIAPSPAISESLDPAAIAATAESLTARLHSAASLALQIGDEASNLHEVERAYTGLERLIAPVQLSEHEEIHATRCELGALVHLVNAELRRRIEDVHAAIQSLRDTLSHIDDVQ